MAIDQLLGIKIPSFENESWRKRSVCSQSKYSPADFFDNFEKMNKKDKESFVAVTCNVCPVKVECNEWAHRTKPEGLHAGVYWRNNRPGEPWRVGYMEDSRDRKASLKKDLTPAA